MEDEEQLEKVGKIIDELKALPLFYLFLGSQETFHSNFWYWLQCEERIKSTSDREKIINENFQHFVAFFSQQKLTNSIDYVVDREVNVEQKGEKDGKTIARGGEKKTRLDLMISKRWERELKRGKNKGNKREEKTPVIVIENKVKDFPTKSQLDRIQSDCKKKFPDVHPEFILVTLFYDPNVKYDNWKIVTYESFVERLKLFYDNFEDPFEKELLNRYCTFLEKLIELSKALTATGADYNFYRAKDESFFTLLDSAKLWEAYQKYRGNYFKEKMRSYLDNAGISFESRVTLHHKNATIDFEIPVFKEYEIGVQIENNQFRTFVRGDHAEEIVKRIKEVKLLFTESKKGKEINTYGPRFKYSYSVIENNIDDYGFENMANKVSKRLGEIDTAKDQIIQIINDINGVK